MLSVWIICFVKLLLPRSQKLSWCRYLQFCSMLTNVHHYIRMCGFSPSFLDQFPLTRCSLLMFNFMAAASVLSSLSLSFCKCAVPFTRRSVGSGESNMCSKHPEIPQKRRSCNTHVTAMFKVSAWRWGTVCFLKSLGKYMHLGWHGRCTLLAASCHSGRRKDGG